MHVPALQCSLSICVIKSTLMSYPFKRIVNKPKWPTTCPYFPAFSISVFVLSVLLHLSVCLLPSAELSTNTTGPQILKIPVPPSIHYICLQTQKRPARSPFNFVHIYGVDTHMKSIYCTYTHRSTDL